MQVATDISELLCFVAVTAANLCACLIEWCDWASSELSNSLEGTSSMDIIFTTALALRSYVLGGWEAVDLCILRVEHFVVGQHFQVLPNYSFLIFIYLI